MDIHKDARARFDEVAASVRARLTTPEADTRSTKPLGWSPEIQPKFTLTEEDIESVRVEGPGGIRSDSYQIPPEAAVELRELAFRFADAIRPKGQVCAPAVMRAATEWAFSTVSECFSDACLRALKAEVVERKVWVPVHELHIETEFDVGPVRFTSISAARIDSWYAFPDAQNMSEEDRGHIARAREKQRERIQGHAAGTVTITSDRDLAQFAALEEVSDALSALRIFGPASQSFGERSYCVPHGMEHVERHLTFMETATGFDYFSEGLADCVQPWSIGEREIQQILASGLSLLGSVIFRDPPTDFQTGILSAVRLFGQSTVERSVEIRLVLLLAALEGIFLKDHSEPIQQNLGERIALAAYKGVEQRQAAVKLIKNAYNQRSRFVHHSQELDADPSLDGVLEIARRGVMAAAKNVERFPTSRSFCEAIDRMKLSS